MAWKRDAHSHPSRNLAKWFGIRSLGQLGSDLSHVVGKAVSGKGFQLGLDSLGFIRPDLSLPTYFGFVPKEGVAPIYHLFDRTLGGREYSQRVTRTTCYDFRGKQLTYDQHDGVDFVCPIGTRLVSAAPGKVILVRDRWLRGGLTVTISHGNGLFTQYTHLERVTCSVGQIVERGQEIGRSGVSGIDMTTFFPWIPPHLHFAVIAGGRFVDPFIKESEDDSPGVWWQNSPIGNVVFPSDREWSTMVWPEPKLEDLAGIFERCNDPKIRAEFAECTEGLSGLALLIDSSHHDRYAWPVPVTQKELDSLQGIKTGTPDEMPSYFYLTMPLNWEAYKEARFADDWFSV